MNHPFLFQEVKFSESLVANLAEVLSNLMPMLTYSHYNSQKTEVNTALSFIPQSSYVT